MPKLNIQEIPVVSDEELTLEEAREKLLAQAKRCLSLTNARNNSGKENISPTHINALPSSEKFKVTRSAAILKPKAVKNKLDVKLGLGMGRLSFKIKNSTESAVEMGAIRGLTMLKSASIFAAKPASARPSILRSVKTSKNPIVKL